MPRPKAPGAPEPKKRSRTGCWNCKAKKVKCDEARPRCLNCDRNGEKVCDYSIRLNWEGRAKRKGTSTPEPTTPGSLPDHSLGILDMRTPISFATNSSAGSPFGEIDPALGITDVRFSSKDFKQSGPRISKFKGYVPQNSTPRSDPRPSTSGSSKRKSRQEEEDDVEEGYSSDPLNAGKTSGRLTGSQTFKRTRFSSGLNQSSTAADLDHSHPATSEPTIQTPPFSPYVAFQSSKSAHRITSSSEDYSTAMRPATLPMDSRPRGPAAAALIQSMQTDSRRLSVNSLLIQEEADAYEHRDTVVRGGNEQSVFYGIDRRLHDRDVPDNDDFHVLDIVTPTLYSAEFGDSDNEMMTEFGFGLSSSKVGCYDGDIQVKISKALHPLPELLHANPMNLMYFHFFIESTARILVPHDCPANPFKVILPQMAIRDENLLHLLLAYAASHRARQLGHPQPSNRIAIWVRDVFPNLRHALEDPATQISAANVAAAIMLASLEIIAPGTFGVEIPWQDHLNMARSMITSRGGPRGIDGNRDKVSHFLIRWFAYLDVLGSFSSVGVGKSNVLFSGDLYDFGKENDFSIDCLLGFSGYLAGILAKIADLARKCDQERLTAKGEINSSWEPPIDVVETAEKIKDDLARARTHKYTVCPHQQSRDEEAMTWESIEMAALNEAFHWAGMVHLHRRVLGLPQESEDVQGAVREIVGSIYNVRKGGSAEACLIFPLFTAGCESREESQREYIQGRIKTVEESGMTQVQKARRLLERVWSTGQPWETLVHGEFFG